MKNMASKKSAACSSEKNSDGDELGCPENDDELNFFSPKFNPRHALLSPSIDVPFKNIETYACIDSDKYDEVKGEAETAAERLRPKQDRSSQDQRPTSSSSRHSFSSRSKLSTSRATEKHNDQTPSRSNKSGTETRHRSRQPRSSSRSRSGSSFKHEGRSSSFDRRKSRDSSSSLSTRTGELDEGVERGKPESGIQSRLLSLAATPQLRGDHDKPLSFGGGFSFERKEETQRSASHDRKIQGLQSTSPFGKGMEHQSASHNRKEQEHLPVSHDKKERGFMPASQVGIGRPEMSEQSEPDPTAQAKPSSKRDRNVFRRMTNAFGPIRLLTRCVEERLHVRVMTRGAKLVRSICRGYIVAFDKHFNMALIDVDEIYRRPAVLGKVRARRTHKLIAAQKVLKEERDQQRKLSIQWDTSQKETFSLSKGLISSSQESAKHEKLNSSNLSDLAKISSQSSTQTLMQHEQSERVKGDSKNIQTSKKSVYDSSVLPISPFEREVLMLGIADENVEYRHVNQLFIRGENVVLVSIINN